MKRFNRLAAAVSIVLGSAVAGLSACGGSGGDDATMQQQSQTQTGTQPQEGRLKLADIEGAYADGNTVLMVLSDGMVYGSVLDDSGKLDRMYIGKVQTDGNGFIGGVEATSYDRNGAAQAVNFGAPTIVEVPLSPQATGREKAQDLGTPPTSPNDVASEPAEPSDGLGTPPTTPVDEPAAEPKVQKQLVMQTTAAEGVEPIVLNVIFEPAKGYDYSKPAQLADLEGDWTLRYGGGNASLSIKGGKLSVVAGGCTIDGLVEPMTSGNVFRTKVWASASCPAFGGTTEATGAFGIVTVADAAGSKVMTLSAVDGRSALTFNGAKRNDNAAVPVPVCDFSVLATDSCVKKEETRAVCGFGDTGLSSDWFTGCVTQVEIQPDDGNISVSTGDNGKSTSGDGASEDGKRKTIVSTAWCTKYKPPLCYATEIYADTLEPVSAEDEKFATTEDSSTTSGMEQGDQSLDGAGQSGQVSEDSEKPSDDAANASENGKRKTIVSTAWCAKYKPPLCYATEIYADTLEPVGMEDDE